MIFNIQISLLSLKVHFYYTEIKVPCRNTYFVFQYLSYPCLIQLLKFYIKKI